jgi:hypothetical protein
MMFSNNVHERRLSGFTVFSLEIGYLTCALLGAFGLYLVIYREAKIDLYFGIGLGLVGLAGKVASQTSLKLQNDQKFCHWGILVAMGIGLWILDFGSVLTDRNIVFSAPFFLLAAGLWKGFFWVRQLWLFLTLAVGIPMIFLAAWEFTKLPMHMIAAPLGYVAASILIGFLLRWQRRPGRRVSRSDSISDICELWDRGRVWEIFDISSETNKLKLAEQYGNRLKQYSKNRQIVDLLDKAFEILQVDSTNNLYAKSRAIMDCISRNKGKKNFHKCEARVWKKLWEEVKRDFGDRHGMLTDSKQKELCAKYTEMC